MEVPVTTTSEVVPELQAVPKTTVVLTIVAVPKPASSPGGEGVEMFWN